MNENSDHKADGPVEELPAVKEEKELLKIADAIEVLFVEAPVDFLGTGSDSDYANKECDAWYNAWREQIKKLREFEPQKAEPVSDKVHEPTEKENEQIDELIASIPENERGEREFEAVANLDGLYKASELRAMADRLEGNTKEVGEPVEGQESQEELWTVLMTDWFNVSMNMPEPHILPHLKSKFHLTRRGKK